MAMAVSHRSFQYIDDLIDGLLLLMNTQDEITGPVNLGNPEEITILQLGRENHSNYPFKIVDSFQTPD